MTTVIVIMISVRISITACMTVVSMRAGTRGVGACHPTTVAANT